jgi:hypothetical protein
MGAHNQFSVWRAELEAAQSKKNVGRWLSGDPDYKQAIFQVCVGVIDTKITIMVLSRGDRTYVTAQDYAIKTDWQAGLYRVRYRPYEIPGEALDNALSTYCDYYELAVDHGYKPKASWFVRLT